MALTQKLYLVSTFLYMLFYSESLIRDPPGGAINVFNWSKEKKNSDRKNGMRSCHSCPLSFVWTQSLTLNASTSPLRKLNGSFFLVYIDNIYGLHLKAQKKVRIENNLNFFYTVLYQNTSWQGNNCLMFHIC